MTKSLVKKKRKPPMKVAYWSKGGTFKMVGLRYILTKIGKEERLSGNTLKMYVAFMADFFGKRGHFDQAYAAEWAGRFRKRSGYAHADGEHRKKLLALNKKYRIR